MTSDHASWGPVEDWALADLHLLATSCAMGLPDSCPDGFQTSAIPAPHTLTGSSAMMRSGLLSGGICQSTRVVVQ